MDQSPNSYLFCRSVDQIFLSISAGPNAYGCFALLDGQIIQPRP